METVIVITIIAAIFYLYSKHNAKIENEKRIALEFEKKKRKEIEAKEVLLLNKENELNSKEKIVNEKILRLNNSRDSLRTSFATGRNWLASMITEAEINSDKGLENFLKYKKKPAITAAENVKNIASEKREWMQKAKDLEYQIKQLEEYFPFLEEYKHAIQEELVTSIHPDPNVDPVIKFLSVEEWNKLSMLEREQMALERYLLGASTNSWEAGLKYERYLGYLYEEEGWNVEYVGAIKGLDDYGRDLICSKSNVVRVIQAKRWSDRTVIHMKHVVQLFGTSLLLKHERKYEETPISILVSTTAFADDAIFAAKALGVKLEVKPFDKIYPAIKFHKSRTGEPLYHLPYDQQYDRIKMNISKGDKFLTSVEHAKKLGARRAQQYQYQN